MISMIRYYPENIRKFIADEPVGRGRTHGRIQCAGLSTITEDSGQPFRSAFEGFRFRRTRRKEVDGYSSFVKIR
jgi:hypothetical protein